jgi:hypothetical protein
MHNSEKDIINYFYDVESSAPPLIRIKSFVKSPSKWNQSVYFNNKKDDVTWISPIREKLDTPEKWVHRVYLGIFKTELLIEEFSQDIQDLNELKTSYHTCLISFMVDQNGSPMKNTLVIPDYLSSLYYYLNGKEQENKIFLDKIIDAYSVWENAVRKNGMVAKKEDIYELLKTITKLLNWPLLNKYLNDKPEYMAYIESLNSNYYRKLTFDSNITTSPISSDLLLVLKKIEEKSLIKEPLKSSLKKYLNDDFSTIEKSKVDVIKNRDVIKEKIAPDYIPDVTWPFTNGSKLVLSQQFSVNTLLTELQNEGLFSVNGPPGTGKTTLLKEIIANIIYQRALKLVEFRDNPKDAFSPVGTVSYRYSKSGEKEIYSLHKSLKGFEIVVASSNNGAVQNITNELPLFDEIDKSVHKDILFFSEIASNINSKDSWGTICATLGNKQNNNKFLSNFIFDGVEGQKDVRPIFEFLKNHRYFDEHVMGWEEACDYFQVKKRNVEKIKEYLLEVDSYMKNYNSFANEFNDSKVIYDEKVKKYNLNVEDIENTIKQQKELEEKLSSLHAQHDELHKVSFWGKVNPFKKTTDTFRLDEEILELKKQDAALTKTISNKTILIRKEEEDITAYQKTLSSKQEKLHIAKQGILNADNSLNIPTEKFWAESDDVIQLKSPWVSNKLNEARIELFIASLQLHKSFIIQNKDPISSNLRSLTEVINGDFTDKDLYTECIWQTLFLICPVVSTTFASLGKLFNGMGENSIGWLLVDEAGQATPQSPVGGLFRAKRAVFVGDPLQVQPVVQVEAKLSDVLLKKNNVSHLWNSCSFSAQQVADRNNIYGTTFGYGENSIWVGSPLRVHRRCYEPMFSIANRIAYNNSMIFGKKEKIVVTKEMQTIGEQQWIQVEGETTKDSHFIKKEAEVLFIKLRDLMKLNPNELPKVYVISPFKTVAFEISKLLKQHKAKWCSPAIKDDDLSVWVGNHVGTIHAFQGKETDIVFLVLGGNIDKPGAITWVCNEPNILNVAVTRAKYAFYIIGNEKVWNKGVFGIIKKILR